MLPYTDLPVRTVLSADSHLGLLLKAPVAYATVHVDPQGGSGIWTCLKQLHHADVVHGPLVVVGLLVGECPVHVVLKLLVELA
jgi:hypothetical protein